MDLEHFQNKTILFKYIYLKIVATAVGSIVGGVVAGVVGVLLILLAVWGIKEYKKISNLNDFI